MRAKIPGAIIALSAVISTVAMLAGFLLPGLAFWVLGYSILLYRQYVATRSIPGKWQLRSQTVTRICFTFGVAAPIIYLERSADLFAWISLVVTLFLIRFVGSLAEMSTTGFMVANLGELHIGHAVIKYLRLLVWAMLLLPVIQLGLAFSFVPGYISLIPVLATVALAGVEARRALARRRSGPKVYAQIPGELRKYAPQFAIHWSAPKNTKHQLDMWMPYFERMEIPFIIIARTGACFDDAVAAGNGRPVIYVPDLNRVAELAVDSITTLFYVNNSPKNEMGARLRERTHIQLLHGDSEKISSFSPVSGMFDRIYVAGQAGIDRYEDNGVLIRQEKFRIVGRPQVEGVLRDDTPITEKPNPVVLYAPTWRGYSDEASYSSLDRAYPMIQDLLERGLTVIFRAHPYAYWQNGFPNEIRRIQDLLARHAQETGTPHVFGAAAEKDMSVFECFNASDAMITDVSSVANDYLYSGKPFATMVGEASSEEYIRSFPIFNGSYVMDVSRVAGWRDQLTAMLERDPLRDRRLGLRSHYLGDFPAEGYADVFVETARRDVLGDRYVPLPPR